MTRRGELGAFTKGRPAAVVAEGDLAPIDAPRPVPYGRRPVLKPLKPLSQDTILAALKLRHIKHADEVKPQNLNALAEAIGTTPAALQQVLRLLPPRINYAPTLGQVPHANAMQVPQRFGYDTAPMPSVPPRELHGALFGHSTVESGAALRMLLQDGGHEAMGFALKAASFMNGHAAEALVETAARLGATPSALAYLAKVSATHDGPLGQTAAKHVAQQSGKDLGWARFALNGADPQQLSVGLAVLRASLESNAPGAVDVAVGSGSLDVQRLLVKAMGHPPKEPLVTQVLDAVEKKGSPEKLKGLLGFVAQWGDEKSGARAWQLHQSAVPPATTERNRKAAAELPAPKIEAATRQLNGIFSEAAGSRRYDLDVAVASWAVKHFGDGKGGLRRELAGLAADLVQQAVGKATAAQVSEPRPVLNAVLELRHHATGGTQKLNFLEGNTSTFGLLTGSEKADRSVSDRLLRP